MNFLDRGNTSLESSSTLQYTVTQLPFPFPAVLYAVPVRLGPSGERILSADYQLHSAALKRAPLARKLFAVQRLTGKCIDLLRHYRAHVCGEAGGSKRQRE